MSKPHFDITAKHGSTRPADEPPEYKQHRVGTVFGDKKRAKNDLSATALNAHARLIIIRDCKIAFDALREHMGGFYGLPEEVRLKMNRAIDEVEHHYFLHREELEPVGYPAEEARKLTFRQAMDALDEGELEIDDEDPEMDAIRAHIEAQGDEV